MVTHSGCHYREAAPICVVVMAVNASKESKHAVRSIIGQSVPVEIVVVNSGRGSVAKVLGGDMDHVRLVERSERLLPGGARNLGVRHSHAPLIAFLAEDCVALPDWCERRLRAHRAGHATVASALIPAPNGQGKVTPSARAGNWIAHRNRIPEIPEDRAGRFGLSYERHLFAELGLFREDLLVGEDSEFNQKVADKCGIALWDREIVTMHRYPFTFASAAWDQFHRARRSVSYQIRYNSRSIGEMTNKVIRERGNARKLIARLYGDRLAMNEYQKAYRMMDQLFHARLLGALSLWCRLSRY